MSKTIASAYGVKSKSQLQELAVKYGICATHASRMGILSLATCVAVAAFLTGCFAEQFATGALSADAIRQAQQWIVDFGRCFPLFCNSFRLWRKSSFCGCMGFVTCSCSFYFPRGTEPERGLLEKLKSVKVGTFVLFLQFT